MTSSLEKGQLVGGETDDLDQAVLGSRALADATAPGVRASPVRVDVQEQDSVHPVLLQLRGHVLTVALEAHELGQVLPPPDDQVFAAHLAVKHLVPQPGVEPLRVGLPGLVELEGDVRVHAQREVIVDHVEGQILLALGGVLVVGRGGVAVALHLQLPAVEYGDFALGHGGQYFADRLVRVAAAPAEGASQVVSGAQGQRAHGRRWIGPDLVQDRQYPSDRAVAAASQDSQVRYFLEQLQPLIQFNISLCTYCTTMIGLRHHQVECLVTRMARIELFYFVPTVSGGLENEPRIRYFQIRAHYVPNMSSF